MFSSNSSQVSSAANYIEDVFSTYLYAGTNANITINNGIDLAGKGGLVWQKQRTSAIPHRLFTTAMALGAELASNSTGALTNAGNVNGYLNNVLQAIQQIGTIAMYQCNPAAGNISLAIYPTGAYTTATLVAAAQTANATGGLDIGIPTANVSNVATFSCTQT